MLNVGDKVGSYELLELIGEGGMGVVWRAKHPHLDRNVAVKLIRRDGHLSAESKANFLSEIKVLSQLHSPQILQVVDAGTLGTGDPYMVTEYLSGEDLASLINRPQHISPLDACRVGIDILKALTEAHALGIVHGDLHPGNIFVLSIPGEAVASVKVLDFGIASLLDTQCKAETSEGSLTMRGNLHYAAPEQFMGQQGIAADIYAFGATMYTMLTGEVPFQTVGTELLNQKLTKTPKKLSEYDLMSHLEPLDDFVLSCLSREPAQRPQKALALRRRLEAIRDRLSGLETEENVSPVDEQRFSTMVDQSVPDWLETGFAGESNHGHVGSGTDARSKNAVMLDWQSSGQADPSEEEDQNLLLEAHSQSILKPTLATSSDFSQTVEYSFGHEVVARQSNSPLFEGTDSFHRPPEIRLPENDVSTAPSYYLRLIRWGVGIGFLLAIAWIVTWVVEPNVNEVKSKPVADTEHMKSKIAENLERSKALLATMQSERRNTKVKEAEVRKILVILGQRKRGVFFDDKTGRELCGPMIQSCPVKRTTSLRVNVDGYHPIYVSSDTLKRHPRESITLRVGPPMVQPEKK